MAIAHRAIVMVLACAVVLAGAFLTLLSSALALAPPPHPAPAVPVVLVAVPVYDAGVSAFSLFSLADFILKFAGDERSERLRMTVSAGAAGVADPRGWERLLSFAGPGPTLPLSLPLPHFDSFRWRELLTWVVSDRRRH